MGTRIGTSIPKRADRESQRFSLRAANYGRILHKFGVLNTDSVSKSKQVARSVSSLPTGKLVGSADGVKEARNVACQEPLRRAGGRTGVAGVVVASTLVSRQTCCSVPSPWNHLFEASDDAVELTVTIDAPSTARRQVPSANRTSPRRTIARRWKTNLHALPS